MEKAYFYVLPNLIAPGKSGKMKISDKKVL